MLQTVIVEERRLVCNAEVAATVGVGRNFAVLYYPECVHLLHSVLGFLTNDGR